MTSSSYFGKMNSILGSVVPLAMFSYKVIFKVCNICFRFQKYAILVPTANSLRTVCMILYVDMLSLCDHWLLFFFVGGAKRNVRKGHRFHSENRNTDGEIKSD